MLLGTNCAIAVKASPLDMHSGCTNAWKRVLFLLKRHQSISRSKGHNSRYGSGLALLEESVLGNGLPFRGSSVPASADVLEHCHRHGSCQCVFLARQCLVAFHTVIFQTLVLATIQKHDSAMEERCFIYSCCLPRQDYCFSVIQSSSADLNRLTVKQHKHK